MAKCKECLHELGPDDRECPACGCPVEDFNYQNNYVLNEGKSNEAESVISDYARGILKWGNILSWISLISSVLVGFIYFVLSIKVGDNVTAAGFAALIVSIIGGLFYFWLIRFIAKLIWANIMLFVNMSTTLKRIENKLG